MVVQSNVPEVRADLGRLDLGYLALFVGLRVNEVVMERARAAGFTRIRQSHGYVIQHLIEAERSITELARRMEVTQQAASKAVAELVELGALEVSEAPDRRARRVRLSARGWKMVRLGRRARQRVDSRLRAAAGAKTYETARAALQACLRALGGVERIQSRRIREPR